MWQAIHLDHLRPSFKLESASLIDETLKQQWLQLDHNKPNLSADSYYKFLSEAQRMVNPPPDNRSWSAVFVSFVMKCAGYMDFKFSAYHAYYIHDSIINRQGNLTSSFWGFRLDEHIPTLGDIICRKRKPGQVTFDLASTTNDFASHCDIVVHVENDHIKTIGGDLHDSVSMTTYPVAPDGHLRAGAAVFAVLRNNF
jgi:hypothetical protein